MPLAPGDNRRENPIGFSGAENKYDVGRRLLQRLQEGVGCLVGQHVGFIDDVDFAFAFHRREVDLFPYISNFVNSPVAGRIQLDDVHEPVFICRDTHGAGVARITVLVVQAVDRFGQYPCGGGLAGAPWPAKQVGVGNPFLFDGLA